NRLSRPLLSTEQQELNVLLRELLYLPIAVVVEDPIAASLFVSISQVHHMNAVAAEYLFLAACVERRDISLDLLDAASLQVRENAIKVLDRFALITRRPAESALDIYRLVHNALRRRLQAQGRFRQWNERAVT
ncbi:hypothetical protein J1614_003904, partial [Plenodomus biglobosus]